MVIKDIMYSVHLGPAECAVDLGDGSERASYVNQDYILQKMGRPHRGISLMYCYYPLDKDWPQRASEIMNGKEATSAWDHPYDDYFTYKGGLNGNREGEPFTFMRDVRRHGQDVILTLTCDPRVPDEHLIAIAKDLRTFGRMKLRINHEATGNWFAFNKRCTYQEVADFFVKFCKIIKEYAPNVSTILCIDGLEDLNATEIGMEKEFSEAVITADNWSADKYMALHWGWPYDVAEAGGETQKRDKVDAVYELTKKSYERFKYINKGKSKEMLMSEFNADGDVTGPYEQAEMVREFVEILKADKDRWLSGFTFYQFRDDGRLGLEITDPNNKEVGIEQPVMDTYRKIIHEDFFKPSMTNKETAVFPAKLRWGSFEDSDGISIPLEFEKDPVFAEVYFDKQLQSLNLIMEINGTWFYKAPGVKCIDLMSAFFKNRLSGPATININMFAPPASGENNPEQGNDWQENYYTVIDHMPEFRLRFEPTIK